MIWVFQRLIGMPRVAAIEHPFGRPFGDVDDVAVQREVLVAALALGRAADHPGQIEHLPFRWHEEPDKTHWHPAEPSPIIALMQARKAKRVAREQG
jgi:hypothetical protein